VQNQLRAGSTVVEPTKKAKASVAEVIKTSGSKIFCRSEGVAL